MAFDYGTVPCGNEHWAHCSFVLPFSGIVMADTAYLLSMEYCLDRYIHSHTIKLSDNLAQLKFSLTTRPSIAVRVRPCYASTTVVLATPLDHLAPPRGFSYPLDYRVICSFLLSSDLLYFQVYWFPSPST